MKNGSLNAVTSVHSSFTRNAIQANRYVLGAQSADLTVNQWQELVGTLGMPMTLQTPFLDKLPQSSTVLVGFDLTTDQVPGYKVYLEFMDAMPPRDSSSSAPFLLGIGYKWQVENPEKQLITHYRCLPRISPGQILDRINACYDGMDAPVGQDEVTSIVKQAVDIARGAQFLFLEVSEDDTNRASFDINLYPSSFTINAVIPQLDVLADKFNCPNDQYRRLKALTANQILGHISSGTSSAGQPYFSLYYEA